jgi:hypothetical protein
MRPAYETAQDRSNEQQVVDLLCKAWNCTANKMPAFYQTDWSLSRNGEVKAIVEIKFRNKSYPSYLISLHKFSSMLLSSFASKVHHILVVCWPEANGRVVRYIKVTHDLHSRVVHGGRRDRGDSQDQEPMVEIPMDKFSLLGAA